MLAFADRIRVVRAVDCAGLLGAEFGRPSSRRWPSSVYFAVTGRALKIGSSTRPSDRIGSLCLDSCGKLAWLTGGDPIESMVVLDGTDRAHEMRLHDRFQSEALYSEWYPRDGIVGGVFDALKEIADRVGEPGFLGRRPLRTSEAARALKAIMPGVVARLEAHGLHRTLAYRYAAGTSSPTIDNAIRIERATDGLVPARGWVRDQAPASPSKTGTDEG